MQVCTWDCAPFRRNFCPSIFNLYFCLGTGSAFPFPNAVNSLSNGKLRATPFSERFVSGGLVTDLRSWFRSVYVHQVVQGR